MSNQLRLLTLTVVVCLACCTAVFAQTTAFTYQGKLGDGGSAATGTYDFQFKLYDALTGGSLQGTPNTVTITGVTVSAGTFTVQLDFGASAFPGGSRFLEISVKRPADSSYTPLSPRQPITSTPYAQRSLNAEALFSGGQRAFGVTGTATWPNSNTFAGVGAGSSNTPGVPVSTSGSFNSFFGERAGSRNTEGNNNSFFGTVAGFANTKGFENSFFGVNAGFNNTLGDGNSAIGVSAGANNTEGNFNTFLGQTAGISNTTENNNTFVGARSNGQTGITNATAIGFRAQVTQSNSLVLGSINGVNGATADTNVGIGTTAPAFKLEVVDPSFKGLRVQTNTDGGAVASFGSKGRFEVDGPGIPGGRFLVLENGNVGIGTTQLVTPTHRLQVIDSSNSGLRVQNNATGGTVASFGSNGNFAVDAPLNPGGRFNILENGNVGIGAISPTFKLEVINPSNDGLRVQSNANGLRVQTNVPGGFVASFGGNGAFQIDAPGTPGGRFMVLENGNVGIGTSEPLGRLQVATANDTNPLFVTAWDSRHFVIGGSASAGGIGLSYDQTNNVGYISSLTPNVSWRNLVLQPGNGNVGIGTGATAPAHKLHVNGTVAGVGPYVDASDLRYKRGIRPIAGALAKVLSLRGVTFDWRREEFPALNFAVGRSVGFVAQEVEQIVPEAVTRDAEGFRSVAYSHLTPVLVEAVKEQQTQIEQQQKLIEAQQQQIEALKKLVCATNRDAGICKQ